MPIYEYRCENGHEFEVMQRMSDDAMETCPTCEAPVRRVLHPVAVHFKGSGFYNTDYGKRRRNGAGTESGEQAETKESKDSKDSSKGSKAETKT
jgi:putative FmdB family regulatory protein